MHRQRRGNGVRPVGSVRSPPNSSIIRLEQTGPVTAPALLDGDNVVAVMAGWLDDMQQASTLVAADLEAIDALATMLGDGFDADTASAQAALELIRSLAQNAVGCLDLTPTDHTATRYLAEVELAWTLWSFALSAGRSTSGRTGSDRSPGPPVTDGEV